MGKCVIRLVSTSVSVKGDRGVIGPFDNVNSAREYLGRNFPHRVAKIIPMVDPGMFVLDGGKFSDRVVTVFPDEGARDTSEKAYQAMDNFRGRIR